jgi:RHS repeat-associated protein
MTNAAAKGRSLLFLAAAFALCAALLAAPAAEATRTQSVQPTELAPPVLRLDVEAPPAPLFGLFGREDELLVEVLSGVEPEHHEALLAQRRVEVVAVDFWDAHGRKTASGLSSTGLGLNLHQKDQFKTGSRWTVPYYAKARYYDPETARFLSQDPVQGDLTNPPSLHRYLYAYGNPTVYIDPDGRIALLSGWSQTLDDAHEGFISIAAEQQPEEDEDVGFLEMALRRYKADAASAAAGLTSFAKGGVDIANLGVNASLVTDATVKGISWGKLTDEALSETTAGLQATSDTLQVIRERPGEVGAAVVNQVTDLASDAISGDFEAQARIKAGVVELAVDVALGSKGAKKVLGIGLEVADTAHDTARALDAVGDAGRLAKKAEDVVPDAPKLKPAVDTVKATMGRADEAASAARDGLADLPAVRLSGDGRGRGSPDRGIRYVLEGGDQRLQDRSRDSASKVFEDSLQGTYSDLASGRRVVPALGFDPPASLKGGKRNPFIRFDAVDPSDAQLLIDRKTSIVRFSTSRGPMIPQASRIRETILALDQNPGFRVVYEFPDAAAARSARSILRELGVADPRLTVRVAP